MLSTTKLFLSSTRLLWNETMTVSYSRCEWRYSLIFRSKLIWPQTQQRSKIRTIRFGQFLSPRSSCLLCTAVQPSLLLFSSTFSSESLKFWMDCTISIIPMLNLMYGWPSRFTASPKSSVKMMVPPTSPFCLTYHFDPVLRWFPKDSTLIVVTTVFQ